MSSVVAHKSSPWLISLRRVKTTPTLLPLRFMLRRSHVSRLSKWLSLIVATFFKRWHVHVARGAWTSLLKLILLLVNILHIKTKTPRRVIRNSGLKNKLFLTKSTWCTLRARFISDHLSLSWRLHILSGHPQNLHILPSYYFSIHMHSNQKMKVANVVLDYRFQLFATSV